MLLPNLTTNLMYEVKIQGAVESKIFNNTMYKGDFSDSKMIFLEPGCTPVEEAESHILEVSAGVIAGVICAGFAVFLAVASYVLWRWVFSIS